MNGMIFNKAAKEFLAGHAIERGSSPIKNLNKSKRLKFGTRCYLLEQRGNHGNVQLPAG